jgi:hypothetical protein
MNISRSKTTPGRVEENKQRLMATYFVAMGHGLIRTLERIRIALAIEPILDEP